MNAETKTILDLESMMNDTLDSIPEAPDYSNPPAGEYVLNCTDAAIDKYKAKDGSMNQRLKITYSVAQTVELAETSEPPVADGTMFTETFQGTEQGLSFFKKRIREIMNVEDTTGVTLGDMMASAKGAQFGARISIRKSAKKDANGAVIPNEFYENLQIKIVHKKD